MNWDRVVDDGIDACRLQLLLQPVATAGFRQIKIGAIRRRSAIGITTDACSPGVGYAHDKLIPTMTIGHINRQMNAVNMGQLLSVAGRDGAAALHPAG